jgi:predicted enzyme related to lactoylglutathione lyase
MTGSGNTGNFVWYDLMTNDPAGARGFYTRLIGWGTQQWDGGGQPYTLWTNNKTPLGGVMELPEDARAAGAPPHWLSYVAVDDIKATAPRAEELGGSVLHGPVDIPNAGSFAVLADPQGAVFAIYQSDAEYSADSRSAGVGGFSWHELATSDSNGAFRFYSELFGWKPGEALDMGEAGIYQLFGSGGSPLGGMFNKPNEMPGPPMWLYYIKVKNVNDAVKRVAELGGRVINGPMEVPDGDLIAQCLDPQGALFAVHSSAAG